MRLPRLAYEHLLLLILAIIGLGLAWMLARDNAAPCLELCYDLHTSMVDGTALAPYRWRVLSAGLAQALTLADTPRAVQFAYEVAHALLFPLALLFAYRWLHKFAAPLFAFVGVLLLAVLMPLGMIPYGISLYSVVELVIVAWGLSLLPNDDWRARLTLAVLVLLGALNRETTALVLVAAYGAWMLPRWRERAVFAWGVLYAGLMAVIYVALRRTLGDAPPMYPLNELWTFNTTGMWAAEAIVRNALISPIWILGAAGFRIASLPLKRLALVLLVYIPPTLIFGVWAETRLQWTLWLIAAAWVVVWFQRLTRLPR